MTHTEQDAYDEGFNHGYAADAPRYAGKAGYIESYIQGYLDGEDQAMDDECCDFRWENTMESWA